MLMERFSDGETEPAAVHFHRKRWRERVSVSEARRVVAAEVACAVVEGELWEPGETLVVAVSGGADSLCLLGALLDLRERGMARAPGDLVVATLDHGLRGADGRG